MRDKSKQLLVINTGKKQSEQTGMPSQSGTTHIIGGGGLSANMSDYLLKSIWDKVWEIRTDSQGTEYIFGKIPVVTQYGITMYSGDGVDVPSLASGLPFDGRTIWYNPETQQIEVIGGTGGGSGEGVSNFWDLSGIPSWITNTKPKYSYSEIEGTPDLTKYALASQIPSLSGYATESWVLQKNYATKATTLSGYGITDAYTKTNVDDLLKAYVTLSGSQTITGEKNFTGGLKVNGSPIVYDSTNKYWKLEGDLLVTGGVTMYGNEGTYTPSTIMDALLYDDATLGINSNGQLYVKGGTSGEGLDITALQNYLTSNSYLNVTGGDNRYLKLSGGVLSSNSRSPLTLKSGSSENHSLLLFNRGSDYWGSIGFNAANSLIFKDTNGANYTIWHSGNDGSGSGLDADTLDGLHNGELKASILHSGGGSVIDANTMQFSDFSLRFYSGIPNTSTNLPTSSGYQNGLLVLPLHSNGSTAQIYLAVGKNPYFRSHHTYEWNEIAYKTDNVSSATKLQTARTIWGQSFDGTGNVSGVLTLPLDRQIQWADSGGAMIYGVTNKKIVIDGSVGIGTTSPSYKLDVNGGARFGLLTPADGLGVIPFAVANSSYANTGWCASFGTEKGGVLLGYQNSKGIAIIGASKTENICICPDGGNVGIGTTNPTTKFDINGKSMEIGTSIYGSGGVGSEIYMSTHREGSTLCARGMRMYVSGSATGIFQSFSIDAKNYGTLSNIMSINSSGNLLVTGGVTMYGSSDIRLKRNIRTFRASEELMRLGGVYQFEYNDDEIGRNNTYKGTHIGLIYQNVKGTILDKMCYEREDGYGALNYLDSSFISLIAAVGIEHETRLQKLERENRELKKELAYVKRELENN